MTPTEIAAQITALYAQLGPLIADEESEWDGDYAALLKALGEGAEKFSDVLDAVAGKDFESETWDRVYVRASAVSARLTQASSDLEFASTIAADFQEETAEAIAAAQAIAAGERTDATVVKTVPARDGLAGYRVHAIREGAPLPAGQRIARVEEYGSETYLIAVDAAGRDHHLHRHTEIREMDGTGAVLLVQPQYAGYAD